MKVQALLVAAVVGSTAFAGEITFDGGPEGTGLDLTAVASVSGTVKLDVTALDLETLKARTKLALFTPGAVADGTTFELVGGADNMSAGVRDDGSLVLYIRRGLSVYIR